MDNYNVRGLRHDVDFRVPLVNDLYWVPLNILGRSRYTNSEILTMKGLEVNKVKELIDNPYEAFQYLNMINFTETKDVYYSSDGSIDWEHHINGYEAIEKNRGAVLQLQQLLMFC